MKRTIKWLLFVLLLKAGVMFPQAPLWQWVDDLGTSNNEVAWDVHHDKSSGNIYACGSFDGSLSGIFGNLFGYGGGKDGFVIKYDQSGNILNAFRIGGNGDDEVKSVGTDPSGNLYVTGYYDGPVDFDPSFFNSFILTSAGSPTRDAFLAKYSPSGTFIWAVKIGDPGPLEEGTRLFVDASAVYITGSYGSSAVFRSTNSTTMSAAATQSLSNFFGAKYDLSGVVQWVVSAGGAGADKGTNVKADNNRVYFIGNYFDDAIVYNASGVSSATVTAQTNNKSNVMVLAFTQAGALSWNTNACSADEDIGYGLTLDNDNVIICGAFKTNSLSLPYPSPTFTMGNAGGQDIFLAAITKTTGVYNWISQSTGSGSGDEVATAIEKTASGDLIVTGSFKTSLNYTLFGGPVVMSSAGNEDVFVTGFNSAGNFQWVTGGGGSNVDVPYGLSSNTNNAVFVAGEYASNAVFTSINLLNVGGRNVFVGKTGCETVNNNIVSSSQTVCTGSAPITFSGTLPTGGVGGYSYQWQRSSNNFTWTAAPGTNTTLNYAAPTTTALVYYRRVLSSGVSCMYPSNTLTVTINNPPDPSVAGSSQSVCSTSATISANNPVVGTGSWSVITGPATITTPGSFSTEVTGLGVGLNRFVWTISNGVCPSSSSTLSVTRYALPSVSSAGSNQTVCANTYTLGANVPVTGNGLWTVLSGGSTLSAAANPSAAANNLGIGSNTYVWTITNGVCPPSQSTVTITRDQIPALSVAGSNQSVCATTATLTAISPSVGTGTWSLITGPAVITSVASVTTGITGLGVGNNIFQWKVINGVCPPSTSTVLIKRDAQPTISNAGSDFSVCAAVATVAANSAVTGTGSWSVITGTASVAAPLSATTNVTGLSLGANAFQWAIANGVCPVSTSTITIFRDAAPSSAVAGPAQTVCSASATLQAQAPAIGSGTWSVITGQALVQNSSLPNSSVINLAAGLNQFEWKVINGVCPPSTSTAVVVRDLPPSVAVTGAQQTVCSVSATLNAQNPGTGTGSWSVTSGPSIISSVINPSSTVTNLQVGQNSFVWTVVSGVCPPTAATLMIQRDALPDVALAGSDQTVCGNATTLTANNPSVGVGSWSVLQGGGTLLSNEDHSTTVSGLSAGENKLIWKIENGVCPNSADTTIVFSFELPSVSNAGSDQQVCSTTVTMNASKPLTGSGAWNKIQSGGQIVQPDLENTLVENLNVGINIFLWSVNNGVCPPSHDTVRILVDQPPVKADAGLDQQRCGTSQQLNAIAPLIGAGQWLAITPGPEINSISSPVSNVSSLKEGKNLFVWIVTNGVCPPSSDTLSLDIDLPPRPAFAGTDRTVCSSAFFLQGEEPDHGKGTWSLVQGKADIREAGSAKSAVELTNDSVVLRWTVVNGVCPSSYDELVIARDTVKPVAMAGDDVITENREVRLSATPDVKYPGTWIILEGSSQLNDPTDARCKVSNLSVGNNRFQWRVTKGECAAATDEVVVYLKEFKIPNGFSPNDDGYNDRFHIDGLENFTGVKLQVFNRWGTLLFEDPDYRNNWNGINQQGENLVEDTYYYVLEVPDKGNYTGFIILKRSR